MKSYDLTEMPDAAYQLANFIASRNFSEIIAIEFHSNVNPDQIVNCWEGFEKFVERNSDLYDNTFLYAGLIADEYPANISIAVKLSDMWFTAKNCGSNYYNGFGPRGIFLLRKACAANGVPIIINDESFDKWYEDQIGSVFTSPTCRKSNSVEDDIFDRIISLAKEMERSRPSYQKLSEEDIRDFTVNAINSDKKFEEFPMFSEAKNGNGKTDILTRVGKRSPDYIVELKKWKGPKSFINALKQLLSYNTTQNTKTGLIVLHYGKSVTTSIKKVESFFKERNDDYSITSDSEKTLTIQMNNPNDPSKMIEVRVLFVSLNC